MKKLFKAMAIIGVALAIGTAGTMDFYTKEVMSDIPKYSYFMLFGGVSMMLPILVNGIIEDNKGGK